MITIKLNDMECTLLTFNNNTYFNDNSASGTITCEVEVVDADDIQTLGESPITSLIIEKNDEVIYRMTKLNAKLNSINEYLMGETMHTTLNIDIIPQGANPENEE